MYVAITDTGHIHYLTPDGGAVSVYALTPQEIKRYAEGFEMLDISGFTDEAGRPSDVTLRVDENGDLHVEH